jgi:hypothetical protein
MKTVILPLGNLVFHNCRLKNPGVGQITLSAGELPSGTYFYTLITDDGKVDTKQMLFAK